MLAPLVMRAFSGLVVFATLAGLAYVFAFPPPSMRVTRDGVPHHAPPVINPATGEAVDLGTLVRHYKGVGG